MPGTDLQATQSEINAAAAKGASTGASVGAVIGSVFPIIGNAIGAALGAAGGGIGGAIVATNGGGPSSSNPALKDMQTYAMTQFLNSRLQLMRKKLDEEGKDPGHGPGVMHAMTPDYNFFTEYISKVKDTYDQHTALAVRDGPLSGISGAKAREDLNRQAAVSTHGAYLWGTYRERNTAHGWYHDFYLRHAPVHLGGQAGERLRMRNEGGLHVAGRAALSPNVVAAMFPHTAAAVSQAAVSHGPRGLTQAGVMHKSPNSTEAIFRRAFPAAGTAQPPQDSGGSGGALLLGAAAAAAWFFL